MPVQRPEDTFAAFAGAFNAGGLDALVTLYEPEALMVPEPGRWVTGHAAIREALQGFLALQGTMTIQPIAIVTPAILPSRTASGCSRQPVRMADL